MNFSADEIEIIEDDIEFRKNQEYLKHELLEIENGNSIFLEKEEAYERLEKVIQKYENNL